MLVFQVFFSLVNEGITNKIHQIECIEGWKRHNNRKVISHQISWKKSVESKIEWLSSSSWMMHNTTVAFSHTPFRLLNVKFKSGFFLQKKNPSSSKQIYFSNAIQSNNWKAFFLTEAARARYQLFKYIILVFMVQLDLKIKKVKFWVNFHFVSETSCLTSL